MAVVLPDGRYLVRRRPHPAVRDAHGLPIPGDDSGATDEVDGAAVRQPDGSWLLRLDPAVWPVLVGDTVARPADGAAWTVTGVPVLNQVPGAGDVDYVAVTGSQVPPDVDQGYPSRGLA